MSFRKQLFLIFVVVFQSAKFALTEEKVSVAKKGHTMLEQEIIKNMLISPQARIFTGANKTGHSNHYDFQTPTYKGGCFNLKNYRGKIKSVDPVGKCVRLFANPSCYGWSQAFYPGSNMKLNSKINGVQSVGPCVDNEFEFAKLLNTNSTNVEIHKANSSNTSFKGVPDVIGDSYTRANYTLVSSHSNPITSYLLGHGNRTESLKAFFASRHMLSTAEAESNKISGQNQSIYNNLAINNKTDEVGFAIPLELAGPADKLYNVFSQDWTQAEKYILSFVPPVKQFIMKRPKRWVYLKLTFFYESPTSLRPIGIWYRINYWDRNNNDIRYGYFTN